MQVYAFWSGELRTNFGALHTLESNVRKYSRAWKMLQHGYLLATIYFDTAENDPSKIWQTL